MPPARARSPTASTSAGEIPNIVSRWANVESQELNAPIRYLFRRAVPDSGGPGKYRGGVCHEARSSRTGRAGPMGLVLFGKGTRAPMSLGLFGGYPGCNVGYTTFRNGNVDELPDRLEALRGEERRRSGLGARSSSVRATSSTSASWAGGGYGDPLDRDPERVLDGCARRASSPKCRRATSTASCSSDGSVDAGRDPCDGGAELRSERLGRPFELAPAERDRRRAHRNAPVGVPAANRRVARRSAPGAAPRSPRSARTGRTMPYCAGSRGAGRPAPRRRPASSS